MGKNRGNLNSFWLELKRRKIIKVTILYAAIAFIVLRSAEFISGHILFALGFPVTLLLAWQFNRTDNQSEPGPGNSDYLNNFIMAVLLVLVIILAAPQASKLVSFSKLDPELSKSIAVLPFANEGIDGSTDYVINGLMVSILNNLAKIHDLEVNSRISVEKFRDYRNASQPIDIPKIAEELEVNYILVGSGQLYNNEIMLSVQLIEGKTDKYLWSKSYRRNAESIIDLQIDVAREIAGVMQVEITPEETNQITKVPTLNQKAYDLYLKADIILSNWWYESYIQPGPGKLETAIAYFKSAIEEDKDFALAYAGLSAAYYALGRANAERGYIYEINYNADMALLKDPQLAEGLIAKAQYYAEYGDIPHTLVYLEEALKYNPTLVVAIRWLEAINYLGDPEEYLYNALQVNRLNIQREGRNTIAIDYIHLCRSMRYLGLFEEAQQYLEIATEYETSHYDSTEEKVELIVDTKGDYQQAQKILSDFMQNPENVNAKMLRFAAQMYYFSRDWKKADYYYQQHNPFIWMTDLGRRSVTLSKLGQEEYAQEALKHFEDYLLRETTIHKYRLSAALQSYRGDTLAALSNLAIFARQDNIPYWSIRFIKDDAMFDNMRDMPEFKQLLSEIEAKFWKNRDRIRANLKQLGLL